MFGCVEILLCYVWECWFHLKVWIWIKFSVWQIKIFQIRIWVKCTNILEVVKDEDLRMTSQILLFSNKVILKSFINDFIIKMESKMLHQDLQLTKLMALLLPFSLEIIFLRKIYQSSNTWLQNFFFKEKKNFSKQLKRKKSWFRKKKCLLIIINNNKCHNLFESRRYYIGPELFSFIVLFFLFFFVDIICRFFIFLKL